MSTSKEQPGLSNVSILSGLVLSLSVLEKSYEGGNPCSRSNHDNGLEWISWQMERVFETAENWNLHECVHVCRQGFLSSHTMLNTTV